MRLKIRWRYSTHQEDAKDGTEAKGRKYRGSTYESKRSYLVAMAR